ncbi:MULTISPECIES: GNAT family N-acetyltransferase [unclassified Curtobacterium]|uniref:GNAT family N-acetyltransferase n=1 Tax=unclassified Curtobacterium TaxID=257496 RepID=UPI000826283E|nr:MULTISPECIES: GNAT family N-acetyltransferase [unclassified Curtobacterium]WIB00408.1 GNAT family N-acetyltransferase [Curtobacterium sp. MCBA15_012]
MEMTFRPLDPTQARDRESLITFLTSNRFPFHVSSAPSRESVEQRISDGAYAGPDHALLSVGIDGVAEGVVVLDDLDDDAPLIDVRLAERARGRGHGAPLLSALATYVFASFPEVDRIEAQTRDDNVAMRRILVRNGWVKEAHYRRTWPVDEGEARDSVAYAILRDDHRTGRVTPFLNEETPAS